MNVKPSTSMCRARCFPRLLPEPGKTCNTPSGSPASVASSAIRKADKGVLVAGFSSTELPVANEGANFQAVVDRGKFHGTIAVTTPRGTRVTSAKQSEGVGAISSYTLSMASPLQRIVRTVALTSIFSVSAIGLPTSRVSSKAISSAWFSINSAQRTSTIFLSAGAMPAHTPLSKVARAIFTA